jgi:hypothetical protein
VLIAIIAYEAAVGGIPMKSICSYKALPDCDIFTVEKIGTCLVRLKPLARNGYK